MPTSKLIQEFWTFGCGPRCLLRIARARGAPMSTEAFIKQFGSLFPHGQCGLTSIELLNSIEVAMSLTSGFNLEPNYNGVSKAHSGGRDVLVCTSKFCDPQDPAALIDLHHCMQLDQITNAHFVLWTPVQDGTDVLLPPFAQVDWQRFEAIGLLM